MRVKYSHLLLVFIFLVTINVFAQDDGEVTETPAPTTPITIWWPDVIARVGENDINPILLEQTASFAAQNPNIIFEHRLKAVGTTGGIMSTLRTASNAATGVLPTLTLIRRRDFVLAHGANYLQSLEGFSPAIQGDLNNALQLGLINDSLFGVPYLLELQHMVYRPIEELTYNDWSYEAVLERGEPFIFPAGRPNNMNDVLALQYLAGGGQVTSDSGFLLNERALTSIFNFYQAAVDDELIDGFALNHTASGSYRNAFVNNEHNMAVFTSSDYLAMYEDEPSLAIAPIPTETGEPITFMNGWMWVMITQDAEEQTIARNYITWMMNGERQSAFASGINMLPSRASALNLGLANDVPVEPYLTLLENARLPLTDAEIGMVGRAIQTYFASILTLENTAEDAVQAVINEVN